MKMSFARCISLIGYIAEQCSVHSLLIQHSLFNTISFIPFNYQLQPFLLINPIIHNNTLHIRTAIANIISSIIHELPASSSRPTRQAQLNCFNFHFLCRFLHLRKRIKNFFIFFFGIFRPYFDRFCMFQSCFELLCRPWVAAAVDPPTSPSLRATAGGRAPPWTSPTRRRKRWLPIVSETLVYMLPMHSSYIMLIHYIYRGWRSSNNSLYFFAAWNVFAVAGYSRRCAAAAALNSKTCIYIYIYIISSKIILVLVTLLLLCLIKCSTLPVYEFLVLYIVFLFN